MKTRTFVWAGLLWSLLMCVVIARRWSEHGFQIDAMVVSTVAIATAASTVLYASRTSGLERKLKADHHAHVKGCRRCWRSHSMVRNGWPEPVAYGQMCPTGKLGVLAFQEAVGKVDHAIASEIREKYLAEQAEEAKEANVRTSGDGENEGT